MKSRSWIKDSLRSRCFSIFEEKIIKNSQLKHNKRDTIIIIMVHGQEKIKNNKYTSKLHMKTKRCTRKTIVDDIIRQHLPIRSK